MEGELPPERAELFRQHLPDCARCQRELANFLQLELLTKRHLEMDEGRAEAQPTPWRVPRWLPPFAGAALMLVLLVVAGRFVYPRVVAPTEDVWLTATTERLLPARLSHPKASNYRPLRDRLMGPREKLEALPYSALDELRRNDPWGEATAFLVRNEPGAVQRTLQILESLGSSPELDSDRAAALLLDNEFEKALVAADAALSARPGYAPALWNRGLALMELGLPWFAAQSFEEVASQQEPGWAEEARDRARHLREQEAERQSRWKDVQTDGDELTRPGLHALSSDFSQAPSARLHFYIAVWSAPSRDRVLELLPLARELDVRATGHVLEDYVQRVSKSDFTRRERLVQEYVALKGTRPAVQEQEKLIASLRGSSGNEDLLLGVLLRLEETARHLDAFAEAVKMLEDPWFDLLVEQERGKAEKAAGHFDRAARTLREAHARCPSPGLEYRCMWLELELSSLFLQRIQPEEAREYATRGWETARAHNEWWLEGSLLWNLAQVSRYVNDAPLARARYGEFLARDSDKPDVLRRVHQHLAEVAFHELRVEEARRELNAALATGQPLSFNGAFALADLSRLSPAPTDEAQLEAALEKAQPGLTPGERVIATHVRGRFFIERDPVRGHELLWRSIEESTDAALQQDPAAARARTYSYTSLLMDAGRHAAFAQALEWMERERGLALPRTCVLTASADSERTLLIARGAGGEVVGHFDDSRRQPLPMDLIGVVPETLLTSLRVCPQVEVLARPPLHGRPGLLPLDMAWSYLTRTTPDQTPPPTRGRHLAVHAVETPREYHLPRLNPWVPSFASGEVRLELTGTEATPERVLGEMRGATEIDLMVHGKDNGSLDTSSLVLAQGREGAELRARDVRAATLSGSPFVVLAACRAAATAYSTQEPLSLPAAFMKAGARGVLAATEEIPDRAAMAVFTSIRERIRQGAPPSVALRDERLRWRQEHPGSTWLDSVLLFE
ncbi:hypothetical protein CYFUS_000650 [Cystobacter fuscus]|uniref:CHAT domain-containing protein n=2 Tax=Cystobacter fuscus TaxID=43 RepID=A0A250IVE5_9BACT|nr:hypothetical protein CYFUS_000650 [Cystobacter fuscus]